MKRIVVLLVVVLLLVGGGAVGAFVMLKGRGHSKPAPPPPKEYESVKVDDLVVNLADQSQQHFMKLSLALEYEKKDEKRKKKMEEGTPRLRDAIITTIGRQTFRSLLRPEGKQRLKDSIREECNKAIGAESIEGVFFTTLQMQ